MNRRISIALALVVTSVAVFGCTAGSDPVDEPQPTEQSSEAALTTVGSSSGDDTGGVSTERPKETHASCMTGCKLTHISNGWCTAYCDCRIYYKGAPAACSEYASGMYIDI